LYGRYVLAGDNFLGGCQFLTSFKLVVAYLRSVSGAIRFDSPACFGS
jgi:hypothetical protein